MKEYLFTLFGVSLIAAFIKVISPEGAMKKHIELICSLCVLAAVVIPAARGIFAIDIGNIEIDGIGEYDTYDYEEIYNSYLLDGNARISEENLKAELAERFSVSADSLDVELMISENDGVLSVGQVTVYIGSGAVAVDPDGITEYINERLSAECRIIYNLFDEK